MTFGYIPLSRKFFHHPLWNEPRNFHPAEAWLDLIQRASFQGEKTKINNQIIELKRGELVASIRFLASRWQWTSKRVQGFLKFLEKEHMIKRRTNQRITVITLCNYELYNPLEKIDHGEQSQKGHSTDTSGVQVDHSTDTPGVQVDHSTDTAVAQADHRRGTTVNKGKKVKNISNSNELEAPKQSSQKILEHEAALLELEKAFPGLPVRKEIEKMKDWLVSTGKKKKNYLAFARNWLRNWQDNEATGNGKPSTKPLQELKDAGAYSGETIKKYGEN